MTIEINSCTSNPEYIGTIGTGTELDPYSTLNGIVDTTNTQIDPATEQKQDNAITQLTTAVARLTSILATRATGCTCSCELPTRINMNNSRRRLKNNTRW